MSFLIFVGMGEWMDSKKEFKIGDYVFYKDTGGIVRDPQTKLPLKVIGFEKRFIKETARYENGEWDFAEELCKISSLVMELL